MFHHIDNYQVYDVERTTGNLDATLLNLVYNVKQSTPNSLVIRKFANANDRVGLGTLATTTGLRSVYKQLGQHLMNRTSLVVSQKLLGFAPSSVAIGGLSIAGPSTDNHLLSFGFNSVSSGFVAYTDKDNVVRRENFTLPTQLSRVEDTIEWTFIKDANNPNEYRTFSLWVNNKPAFIGNVFRQTGSAGDLAARVYGAVFVPADGTQTPSGYLNSVGTNVSMPVYGTTDLVISDARQGLSRVLSRAAATDTGPNTMTPSEVTNSHADIVGAIPPVYTKYLTAITANAEEMYGAPAFDNLSSEAVLAFGLQVLSSKNNPFALDLEGAFRIGGASASFGALPVDLVPKFAQILLETNPSTGLPFTPNEVNTANFGLKVE